MWHATSAPRDKSCTVSNCHVARTMPLQRFGGAKDLFQTNFFLQGCFSIFFTGTKIIFKPLIYFIDSWQEWSRMLYMFYFFERALYVLFFFNKNKRYSFIQIDRVNRYNTNSNSLKIKRMNLWTNSQHPC